MYNLAYAKPDAINAADAAKKADMGPLIRFMLSGFRALVKRGDSRTFIFFTFYCRGGVYSQISGQRAGARMPSRSAP